jgi:hypothetical protein
VQQPVHKWRRELGERVPTAWCVQCVRDPRCCCKQTAAVIDFAQFGSLQCLKLPPSSLNCWRLFPVHCSCSTVNNKFQNVPVKPEHSRVDRLPHPLNLPSGGYENSGVPHTALGIFCRIYNFTNISQVHQHALETHAECTVSTHWSTLQISGCARGRHNFNPIRSQRASGCACQVYREWTL